MRTTPRLMPVDTNEYACCLSAQGDEDRLQTEIARPDFQPNYRQAISPHFTALHLACASKSVGCVRLLIARGVDVNAVTDDGTTPLMQAAIDPNGWDRNPCPILQALLDAGADLTMKDKGGFTAIEYAAGRAHGKSAEHYNGPAVKLFLSQTPLGQQLFDLLQQHGFQRFMDAVLKEGIHDVQALADVLSDPRLDGAWFQDKLDMGMGHVVTLLRHAKELLRRKQMLAQQQGSTIETLRGLLKHPKRSLRCQALGILRELPPAERAQHSASIVDTLEESHWRNREAVKALKKLHPAVLALHAAFIVDWLRGSPYPAVRSAAAWMLRRLEPALLAHHAAAIVTTLRDDAWRVRVAAVQMLGQLTPAVLSQRKEEGHDGARKMVPVVLVQHVYPVLTDPDRRVRSAAADTALRFARALVREAPSLVAKLPETCLAVVDWHVALATWHIAPRELRSWERELRKLPFISHPTRLGAPEANRVCAESEWAPDPRLHWDLGRL